jgi:squalene-hopene/tetraprenyl-beta-curcumene cyclase
MEPVVVSLPLVSLDAQAGGTLTATTREALARMLSQQRADGSWFWHNGAKRSFWREYEGVMLAALVLAQAPDDFSKTPAAVEALNRIRSYATAHPPTSPYAEGWLLWAGRQVDGLATAPQSEAARQSLLTLQGTDGGWAIENLIAGSPTFAEVTVQPDRAGDGYGTGFAIKVLREGGVPADDVRLRRGIAWLKANQRASGRWFVPSLNGRANNVLSNSGTAFAILALHACGEIPKP